MLTQENRSAIEEKLRNYYKDVKQITIAEEEIQNLHQLKERLENNIKNCNIKIIPDANMGVGFDEKVQTSPTGISPQESQIVHQLEHQERQVEQIKSNINKLLSEIADLETRNSSLKIILRKLGHIYIDIIDMSYRKGMSNINIGLALHLSEKAIRKKKTEALEAIYKLLN